MTPENAPKLKITVEGGMVNCVQSETSLDVQIVDLDAKKVGDNWTSEFIAKPMKVFFESVELKEAAPISMKETESSQKE